MSAFVVVAALLVLVAILLIWLPMRRSAQTRREVDRTALNVKIARERLAELKREFDAGELNQEEFEEEKTALEKTLLDDVGASEDKPASASGNWLLPVLALLVPVLAIGGYYYLGDFSALEPQVARMASPAGHAGAKMPDIETAVAMLEEKLKEKPDNAEGWFMLGRTYMAMKHYDKAVRAWRKLRGLMGDQPDVLVRLADGLAMTQGGKLTGEPAQLLEIVLKQDPENIQGLWLMGMAEFEKGDAKSALVYWRKLEPKLASDPASSKELQGMMVRAAAQAGEPAPTFAQVKAPATAATGASIKVSVSLAPSLAAKARPDETVFIYAKAQSGPPMPLAIVRKKVSELPITVELNDSMAMMPAASLSKFQKVNVYARVSASGQAMEQVGDLIGEIAGVDVAPDTAVKVVIDHEK